MHLGVLFLAGIENGAIDHDFQGLFGHFDTEF